MSPSPAAAAAALIGKHIPAVTLRQMTTAGLQPLPLRQFFHGRRVVLFSIQGAFSPACHHDHAPDYLRHVDAFAKQGVDQVACISVNDAWVMAHWFTEVRRSVALELIDNGLAPPPAQQEHGGSVALLSDGNAEFAEATGLKLDMLSPGMGRRLPRFSAYITDNTWRIINVDESVRRGPHVHAQHLLEQIAELNGKEGPSPDAVSAAAKSAAAPPTAAAA
eukprot:TRINITY_DN24484_c0_g1_i1.p1 TRINITY_DN24484_c0_g1~~TRINITY_DN24484_c0_g1_i1.p1  ORF type:complete len:220 (+),score=62.61 TRINITY_DN24484_c0_g1_i1:70-729(+)